MAHPAIEWISLGVGDTTEPLVPQIVQALHDMADRLSHRSTYAGYGPELGSAELKEAISRVLYHGKRSPHEIIVSDGAKCDLGRLQLLFGGGVPVAMMDPSYPVYHDSSLLLRDGASSIQFLRANKDEQFLPDMKAIQRPSLLFLCSPNNPTGKAFTKEELKHIVDTAHKKRCVIIYDVAYRSYIQSTLLPRSIFEIEGADEVAIEVGSFSKMAGLSGVRLGWLALSDKLIFDSKEPILADLSRLMSTIFNGASSLSQQAGLAALTPEGQAALDMQIQGYLSRAKRIKEAILSCSIPTYGGDHSPYVWIHPSMGSSWEAFDALLPSGIITTPGIGFGPGGEGYLRLSSFLKEELVDEACRRLQAFFTTHSC